MDAKLLFEYQAQDADELSVEADEVVTVKIKRGDGWWLVRRASGAEGVIPGNYCEMLPDERETHAAAAGGTPAPETMVLFADFTANGDDELSLRAGTRVAVVERRSDGWTRVTSSRGAGIVPTDYLCRPDELPSGNNPDSEDEGEVGVAPAELAAATAKGTFRAANGAELSVREGETVAVMGRDEGGWTLCAARGMQGLVPTSYLEATGGVASAEATPGRFGEQAGSGAKPARWGGSLFGRLVGSKPVAPPSPDAGTRVMYGSHAYHAQSGGQVSLEAGEAVDACVGEESEGWTRVHTRAGASGLVPSTCLCAVPAVTPGASTRGTATPRSAVTTLTPESANSSRRRGGTNFARVIAPCPGHGSGEVALRDGDEVQVLESRADGWTLVRSLSSGEEGLMPASFLDPPPPLPARSSGKQAASGGPSPQRGSPAPRMKALSAQKPRQGRSESEGSGTAAAALMAPPKPQRSGSFVAKGALTLAEGSLGAMIAPHTAPDGSFAVEEGESVRVIAARSDGMVDVATASGQWGSVPAAFVEGRRSAEGAASQVRGDPPTPKSAAPAQSPAPRNGLITPSPVARRSANPVASELRAQQTRQSVQASSPAPQPVAPLPRRAPAPGPQAGGRGSRPRTRGAEGEGDSGMDPPAGNPTRRAVGGKEGSAVSSHSDPPAAAPAPGAGGVAALRARFER